MGDQYETKIKTPDARFHQQNVVDWCMVSCRLSKVCEMKLVFE